MYKRRKITKYIYIERERKTKKGKKEKRDYIGKLHKRIFDSSECLELH